MASAREQRLSPSGTSRPVTIWWRSGRSVISLSARKSRWKASTGKQSVSAGLEPAWAEISFFLGADRCAGVQRR